VLKFLIQIISQFRRLRHYIGACSSGPNSTRTVRVVKLAIWLARVVKFGSWRTRDYVRVYSKQRTTYDFVFAPLKRPYFQQVRRGSCIQSFIPLRLLGRDHSARSDSTQPVELS
jgi:hypothetical protein